MSNEPVDKSKILGEYREYDEPWIEPFESWLEFLTDPNNLRPGLKSLDVYFGHFRTTFIKATFSDTQPSLCSLEIDLFDFIDVDPLPLFVDAKASDGLKSWIYNLFQHSELEELIIPFKISKLPDLFDKLPKLKSVNLSGSNLDNLPPSFYRLPVLEKLGTSFSGLTDLPPEIANLPLRSLSFGQSISSQVLAGFTELTSLNCNHSQYVVPQEIGQLINLRSLTLSSVTNASDSLLKLEKLETLNLRTHKSASFGFSDLAGALPKLKELKTNNAAAFADVLGNFKNLEILDIDGGQPESVIPKLQQSLALLHSLKRARLERVGLTDMDWCVSLTNLEFLGLGDNAIKAVPQSLANLQKLDAILLSNNPISTFPELLPMPSVTFIDLQGTKIPIDEDGSTDIQPIPEELAKLKQAFPNVEYLRGMGGPVRYK